MKSAKNMIKNKYNMFICLLKIQSIIIFQLKNARPIQYPWWVFSKYLRKSPYQFTIIFSKRSWRIIPNSVHEASVMPEQN